MKRGTKLLILTLCLALVGLGVWGVSLLTKHEPTSLDKGQLIFSLAGVKTLSWTYGEKEITFQLTPDGWVNTQVENYQITTHAQKAITDEINALYARKTIDVPENLSDFGLAQLQGLFNIGYRQPIGACRNKGFGNLYGAVAVAVRLDDGHNLAAAHHIAN